MAVKCPPLPEELRKTHGEIRALTPEQRRAFYRMLLEYWQGTEEYQRILDLQADDERGDEWA